MIAIRLVMKVCVLLELIFSGFVVSAAEDAKPGTGTTLKQESKNKLAVPNITKIIASSESAEIISLMPGTLGFLRFGEPDVVSDITDYETLQKRPIVGIAPVRLLDRDKLVAALANPSQGEHSFGYLPTVALRCFSGFEYCTILVSVGDRQTKVFNKENPDGYLLFVSKDFCDVLRQIMKRANLKIYESRTEGTIQSDDSGPMPRQ